MRTARTLAPRRSIAATRAIAIVATLGVTLGGLTAPALARPSRAVLREFQAGVDAFRLGRLDAARARLERARALEPTLPGPHRFLAAVARAQARWQDCLDAARRALELNPRSAELADTRALHEACRVGAGYAPARAQDSERPAIAVITSEPGAKVTIGGLDYGVTPLAPRPIPEGDLEVVVTKAGWQPTRRTVRVLRGIVTDVDLTLVRAAVATCGPIGDRTQWLGGWLRCALTAP